MAEIHPFPKKARPKAKTVEEVSLNPVYWLAGENGGRIDILAVLLKQMNGLSDPVLSARNKRQPLLLFTAVLDACDALIDILNALILHCEKAPMQASTVQANDLYAMGKALTQFMAKVDDAMPPEQIIQGPGTYAYDLLAEYGTHALLAVFVADAGHTLDIYGTLFIRTQYDSRKALFKALRKSVDDAQKYQLRGSRDYQQVIQYLTSIQRAMTKITGKLP
jgi:hypothetical protein